MGVLQAENFFAGSGLIEKGFSRWAVHPGDARSSTAGHNGRYPERVPNLFILAGPNGAGKSTSAPEVLTGGRRVDEFVNADVIAKEEAVSEIEAGRRTLARLEALTTARRNIAFETTLSSRTRGALSITRTLRPAG